MKVFAITAVVALICVSVWTVSAEEEESAVLVLTDGSFEPTAAAAGDTGMLVEFYAPWCGHCKNLAPAYEATAKALMGKVPVAKVDATENMKTAKRFGVRGYPTVLFVQGENKYAYTGARTVEALTEFAEGGWKGGEAEKIAPVEAEEEDDDDGESAVVVLTDANFDKFMAKSDTGVLLEFYAPWCGHCKNLAPTYEKVAKKLKKAGVPVAKVDATENAATAQRFEVRGYPTVVFAKAGNKYEYKNSRTVEDMVKFAKGGFADAPKSEYQAAEEEEGEDDPNAPSDVITLTEADFEDETQAGTGATTGDWLVMFYAPWCGHCKKLHPTFKRVASELKGKVNVAQVDATASPSLGRRFDIKGFPTVKLFSHGKAYAYEGKRTKSDLVTFATGGFNDAKSTDVPPPPSAFEDVVDTLRHEFRSLKKDMTTLVRFKKNALIVTFSIGGVAGVLLAFAMFACMGGLSPQEIVYVNEPAAPAAAPATAAAATGPATDDDADADAAPTSSKKKRRRKKKKKDSAAKKDD